jgi:hypothetical protein
MVGNHNERRNLARVLALALAVLFVLFVGQALSHSHAKGQSEAACQVCQAAHLGPILPAGPLSVHIPLQAVGYVEPFVVAFHQEFFFHDSPSRAPPTA